jgi:hypothetical protein
VAILAIPVSQDSLDIVEQTPAQVDIQVTQGSRVIRGFRASRGIREQVHFQDIREGRRFQGTQELVVFQAIPVRVDIQEQVALAAIQVRRVSVF